MATTTLSTQEKRVLWLFGFRGMPSKQVARSLQISHETTKSYLKRIREKLRARALPIDCDSRVDLYWAALTECESMPVCQSARDNAIMRLLNLQDSEMTVSRAA